MEISFKGRKMNFGTARQPFADALGASVTDSLVYYSPGTNTVACDTRASDAYVKYASIHECICCGPYKDMAPTVENANQRCYFIDKMIIDEIKDEDEKKMYIQKRIEMFETLIKKHLNPPLEDSFKESLRLLKEMK